MEKRDLEDIKDALKEFIVNATKKRHQAMRCKLCLVPLRNT